MESFGKIVSALNRAPRERRYFVIFTFHVDESYNDQVFNFGGWLAKESEWTRIANQWKKRIEVDSKRHGKLSRYHAACCSSLQGEYEGWSVPDQILHVKKLLHIMTRREAVVIAAGLDTQALVRVFPQDAKDPLVGAYDLATKQLMVMLSRSVKPEFEPRITIIHDRTTGYDGVILNAFNKMKNDPRFPCRDWFVTIAPMAWEDCIPLQPADMIAYDTFKLLSGTVNARKTPRMRRSLRKLLGDGVPIRARYFDERTMRRLRELADKRIAQGSVTGA